MSICATYAWVPLSDLSKSHDVQHREGNVPILKQFDSFLVEGFSVEQEVDTDDASHTVSVYLTNHVCDDLPTTTVQEKYNASRPPPNTLSTC